MSYHIIWSPKSKSTYLKTIKQILDRWTMKEVENFEALVLDLTEKLKMNRKLCPASKSKKIRKCVVHKNVSLIYRIKKQDIELVTFIDNRTDHKY